MRLCKSLIVCWVFCDRFLNVTESFRSRSQTRIYIYIYKPVSDSKCVTCIDLSTRIYL